MANRLLNGKYFFSLSTLTNKKRVCFFSTVPRERLQFENYSIQDIRMLEEMGFEVIIANRFSDIPWKCDLYFSWWASGSILPLIKALLSLRPIITIAGGNEAMFYRDSVDGAPLGYINMPLYKKIATRITLRLSTSILTVSSFMLRDVRTLGAKKPIVVHNCVDTNIFVPLDVDREYITSIFRLERDVVKLKRGENFIRSIPIVLEKHPNQKFLVIGKKGNYTESVFGLVRELDIEKNIFFLDEIANSDILSWIQKSILYVQISDTETFGLSIAEAMSCSVPVLVSSRGAIPELVGECGVYVDHNSIESIAAGMIRFLELNVHEKEMLGRQGRDRIKSLFSFENRKSEIQKIIDQILI